MKNVHIFRKPICLFLIAFFVMQVGWGQVISWDFTSGNIPNINLPGGTTSLTFNTGGTNGNSGCTGNGFSTSGWNVNEYLQIIAPTTGYNITTMTFNVRSSGTGPLNFKIQYSSTGVGGVFTDFGTNFTSGNGVCVARSVDFTSVNVLDNNINTVIRIVFIGGEADGSPATGDAAGTGTFRLDDLTISGTAISTTSTVTFDANGGIGIMSNQSASTSTALTTNAFSRSGFTFAGWNTAANGSGITYLDGASFPFTSNTTLYAQWTAVSSDNCPNGVSLNPTADQTVCQDITTTSITATPSYSGGTGTPTVLYQWYFNTTNSNTISSATSVSGATNASFSPPSTSSDVGTRYYFCVAYATDNNCAQLATTQSLASSAVKVTVKGTPSAPTGSASQSFCTGNTVSQLSATGSSVVWYSAISVGSALNTNTVLTTSNYYATQTVNGCESTNRLTVAAIVNSIPSTPTGNASQTFCSGNTVASLSATGTTVRWYSAASGGSALNSSSALSSTNYFASQTVNGCESSNRFQVAATVNSISIPTNLVSSNANCSSFDLSWDAVNCATGYKLDVSENRDFIETKKYENFAGLTSSGGTLDISSNLDNYTFYSGWSGSKVYVDLNQAKLGTGTAAGNIVTPTIDYSSSGSGSISFKARTFGSDASIIQLFMSDDNGVSFTQIGSDFTLSASYSTYSASFISTSNAVKFKISAKNSSNCRFYLDDVYSYGAKFISGYQDLSVSSTSKTVSGLSPNTKYYYRVRSTDGTNTSASSNVDSITTPALSMTTTGTVSPICYNAATSSSLAYSAVTDNPNSYSIDWNSVANTAGLSDQTATSFVSNASGGTISSIAIPSNVPAGIYNGIMTITNAAGCSITINISLIINALPTLTINAAPSSAIVCTGSNVSLTASGASTYSWSGGISNGSSFSVTTPTTYTVTGTDANGCSATASRTVNYYPASSNVVLASSSVSGAEEQCTESDGYTYYANPASPGQYLFGIYKNGNSFTATVDITVDNVNKYKKNSSSNGANQEHASYIMSRYWNVNATGSIGTGVKVRFFVDPQDIIDLQNARDNDYNTLKNTINPGTLAVISGTEYFKTEGTTYSPTNWIGNKYGGSIVKLTEDAVNMLNGQTYVELSGITSFSGGGIGAAFGPSSNGLFNSGGTVGLPVTWKEVNATVKEEGNWIQWITSSEKNTRHFEVEYSYDAKTFFKASIDIKAAGNSTTDISYNFMHLQELSEMLYYRIKQVDLDGKVDYSKAVVAKRTSKLPEFHVSMYPVPLNVQDLNLTIQTVQKTDITIFINDLLGRGVHTERVSPQGFSTEHKMSLGHLQNGTYYVTIDNGMNKSVQVLVIGK